MTAKRFTYDSKTVSIFKDGEFWLDGNVDTACNHQEICELLNELHEENQERKRAMRIAEQYNEQLLNENKKLKKYLDSISKGGLE